MRSESPGTALQMTASVNEAYLRLVVREEWIGKGRAHFFDIE
jgi:hypothetical protein